MAATAPTSRRWAGAPVAANGQPDGPLSPAGPDVRIAGRVLGAVMIAVLLYAVFAGGASSQPQEARLQVGLAVVALAAVAVLLWRRRLPIAAPRAAWIGIGLLTGFAAWSGLTLAWSVNPAGTWTELNRAIAYVLAAALGLLACSWDRRVIRDVALGYAGVALLVALYALGGKIAPDIHVGGLIDLDHTGALSRLREPVEYWNGLALFLALAVPILLRLVVDETRGAVLRLGALTGLPVLFVAIGLTYSRGGVLAGLVGVIVMMLAAGSRLRTLMYLALGLAAAAPALVIGFTADDLTANFLPVSQRRGEGLLLGAVLLGSIAALVAGGRGVLTLERRTPPSARRTRLITRLLLAALAAAALGGLTTMAVSDRGFGGTVDHAWETFRSPRGTSDRLFDPSRLLSSSSGNRWVWWSEAVGSWSDRPIAGWGAGSFPITHRQYRTNQLDVLQPHSVPLQLLTETGLLGAALAVGGVLALLVAAVGAVRRLPPGPERGVAGALLGACAAWALHACYDWDWDIPAITLPAFLFLGLLAARPGLAPARPALAGAGPAWSAGARLAAVGATALVLGTYAISAILPAWSQSESQGALESVRRGATPAELKRAQSDADFASRLNPLSAEPLLAAASLADRRGRVTQARGFLLDAVGRHPQNTVAWSELARLELKRGDLTNVRVALARVLELDPRNRVAPSLLASAELVTVPPNASATATGTPLVAIVGETPEAQETQPDVRSGLAGLAAAANPVFFPG